mmetsp:Transcript_5706/g.9560  ORF Transcript_5706/g.9560 Transcript_5706/m.9560 type:complete len:242 (-) Transcript_5706:332-1057(-)
MVLLNEMVRLTVRPGLLLIKPGRDAVKVEDRSSMPLSAARAIELHGGVARPNSSNCGRLWARKRKEHTVKQPLRLSLMSLVINSIRASATGIMCIAASHVSACCQVPSCAHAVDTSTTDVRGSISSTQTRPPGWRRSCGSRLLSCLTVSLSSSCPLSASLSRLHSSAFSLLDPPCRNSGRATKVSHACGLFASADKTQPRAVASPTSVNAYSARANSGTSTSDRPAAARHVLAPNTQSAKS